MKSRSLRCVRVIGTGEPLCPPPAWAACNAQFLLMPLLNVGLLRGSACAIPRREDTRQRIGCPRPMTQSRVNDSAKSVFHMRGHRCIVFSACEKRVYARTENMTHLMYEHARDTSNINFLTSSVSQRVKREWIATRLFLVLTPPRLSLCIRDRIACIPRLIIFFLFLFRRRLLRLRAHGATHSVE